MSIIDVTARISIFPSELTEKLLVVRGTIRIHDEVITVEELIPLYVRLGDAYEIMLRKMEREFGKALVQRGLRNG